MLRPITGFHRDEEGHWVAELSCGHGQHTRDLPPLSERPWVRTEAGRASRIGKPLDCLRCDRRELPEGCGETRRTSRFDAATLPPALRARHATRAGVWAVVHVTAGRLRLRLHAGEPAEQRLVAGDAAVIPPEVEHDVEPEGEIDFFVAFHHCGPGAPR